MAWLDDLNDLLHRPLDQAVQELGDQLLESLESETAETFLEILLGLMQVKFLFDRKFRRNIEVENFRGSYKFCTRNPCHSLILVIPTPTWLEVGYRVTKAFATKTDGIPTATVNEVLCDMPVTAHIVGGCPIGPNDREGIVDLDCQVHNYPGLYVVDGSIMPGNPGINASLTIGALAEYAMSRIPAKKN